MISGNILEKRSYQTGILLFLYILFLFLRAPDILIQGRFWAEEGHIFYAKAYNLSFLHALFVVYGGYINLGASGATLIARYLHVPLEYAPYVTTFIGLFFQLLPIYLLLTAKDQWLAPFRVRLLATLLLLFIPESSEISLQSLHIQFHLTLACAFIAFLKTDIHHQKKLKLALLIFAPLCGLLPIVLLPIFFIRLTQDKNKSRLEQFLCLLLGSFVQISFYLYNIKYNIDVNSIPRQGHFSFTDLCSVIFIRDLTFPFLGHHSFQSTLIMSNVFHKLEAHQVSITASTISTLFLFFISSLFVIYPKTRKAFLLFLSALLTLCIAIYGVIGGTIQLIAPDFTERYTFLSQALLAIMLLYFSVTLPKAGKIISNIIILWLLFIGSYNFFHLFPEAKDGGGHVWRQEVQKWRENHSYHPKIWCNNWYIIIPKKLYDSTHTSEK
ncbi:hypothetical protein CIN_09950 [Commensalibacter intestini A911]|uniref:Uncharacterized protein n=1 Tax=Commensalibacter intestini A911 TaxID=1088868 RepID=G6F049_9PROT|nr:hypothetical protein [Commensalibacter intestini]EHD14131.1 hypothetical protein CIN_09950 [Commensalibacter intestini A911]